MPEPSLIPKFLDNALTEPAKEVGRFLGNVVYTVFYPVNHPIEKFRLRNELNLQQYQNDIRIEIDKIPERNLVEPPLNIIGPALETSKYYVEDDTLRIMFAKLIASSMDIHKTTEAHPAFIELIKQLTPLDANNLKIISEANGLPIVNFLTIKDDNSIGQSILDNVFLHNTECDHQLFIGSSMTNLIRLGLIKVDYSSFFRDESVYEIFYTHEIYNSVHEIAIEQNHLDIQLEKGNVQLTAFGQNFARTCIN